MNNAVSESVKGQILHEVETWQRTLNYLQQENVHLKNRLADIVKNGISDQMLEHAEYFQNQFLNKDIIISILKQDIIGERSENNVVVSGETLKKLDKLRDDMRKTEAEFNRIKFEFNNYLIYSL